VGVSTHTSRRDQRQHQTSERIADARRPEEGGIPTPILLRLTAAAAAPHHRPSPSRTRRCCRCQLPSGTVVVGIIRRPWCSSLLGRRKKDSGSPSATAFEEIGHRPVRRLLGYAVIQRDGVLERRHVEGVAQLFQHRWLRGHEAERLIHVGHERHEVGPRSVVDGHMAGVYRHVQRRRQDQPSPRTDPPPFTRIATPRRPAAASNYLQSLERSGSGDWIGGHKMRQDERS
jgi:hypothetical protein